MNWPCKGTGGLISTDYFKHSLLFTWCRVYRNLSLQYFSKSGNRQRNEKFCRFSRLLGEGKSRCKDLNQCMKIKMKNIF